LTESREVPNRDVVFVCNPELQLGVYEDFQLFSGFCRKDVMEKRRVRPKRLIVRFILDCKSLESRFEIANLERKKNQDKICEITYLQQQV